MATEIAKPEAPYILPVISIMENFRTRRIPFDFNSFPKDRRERQLYDVAAIAYGADVIEDEFRARGQDLPHVYNLFTLGYDSPETAVLLGHFGDRTFGLFPPTDALGHAGTVSFVDNGMFLNGRAHPNEYVGDELGPMKISYPLQVLKELARRQRARDGIDPLFILTYVVGTREGSLIKPGHVCLGIDDMELTNVIQTGFGPRAILDMFVGAKFKPKADRTSHIATAKEFAQFAQQIGYDTLFPGLVMGTPGNPEYQSWGEVGLADSAFLNALPNLQASAREIFGRDLPIGQLFGMGPTAELGNMRETFDETETDPDEPDFRVLSFFLATDPVGGPMSRTINHRKVFAQAIKDGKPHRDRLLQFERQYNAQTNQQFKDYSIQGKLIV
jgi:hypothetical protein